MQLHYAPDDAGEYSEDGGRRHGRDVHDRLCGPGPADAGRVRCGVQAGSGEVRCGAPVHGEDRARHYRSGVNAGGRSGVAQEEPADCGDRRGEWLSDRDRHQAAV